MRGVPDWLGELVGAMSRLWMRVKSPLGVATFTSYVAVAVPTAALIQPATELGWAGGFVVYFLLAFGCGYSAAAAVDA